MTALFQQGSQIAERILKGRECLLDFEQSSQRFTMFCPVRKLKGSEPAHRATLWHNRIFNPNVPNTAVILGFQPDWKNVHAEPIALSATIGRGPVLPRQVQKTSLGLENSP